jgi:hypothetical protein
MFGHRLRARSFMIVSSVLQFIVGSLSAHCELEAVQGSFCPRPKPSGCVLLLSSGWCYHPQPPCWGFFLFFSMSVAVKDMKRTPRIIHLFHSSLQPFHCASYRYPCIEFHDGSLIINIVTAMYLENAPKRSKSISFLSPLSVPRTRR